MTEPLLDATKKTKYYVKCRDEGVIGGVLATVNTDYGRIALNKEMVQKGVVKVLENVDNGSGQNLEHDRLVYHDWLDPKVPWKSLQIIFPREHMGEGAQWIWDSRILNTMTFEIKAGEIACSLAPKPPAVTAPPKSEASNEIFTLLDAKLDAWSGSSHATMCLVLSAVVLALVFLVFFLVRRSFRHIPMGQVIFKQAEVTVPLGVDHEKPNLTAQFDPSPQVDTHKLNDIVLQQ